MKLIKSIWGFMGKEHNRLMFIVSFLALIVSLSVAYFTTCNNITQSNKQNSLIFTFQYSQDNIRFIPSNESQKIIEIKILFNGKSILLHDDYLLLGEDKTQELLKTISTDKSIQVLSEYISNGDRYESKAEYKISNQNGLNMCPYSIKPIKNIYQRKL
jgi:CTP-dependent riboflavin kinase